MSENIVVLSSSADPAEADRIARALVEESLAACVQVLPPMRSTYRWEGKVESAAEHLILIKTSRAKFASVQSKISALHSYSVPEIIALPVVAGSTPYLQWLASELDA